jgi:DNA-binding XRE family transcriptional regulator
MAIEITPQVTAMTDARFIRVMTPTERKSIRVAYGATQGEVAAILGVSKQTVLSWESERKPRQPSPAVAAQYGALVRFMIVETGKRKQNRRTPHTPK